MHSKLNADSDWNLELELSTHFPTFSIQKDNQPTQQQKQLRKPDELFSRNCEDEQMDDE
jgi:hypothetical protein